MFVMDFLRHREIAHTDLSAIRIVCPFASIYRKMHTIYYCEIQMSLNVLDFFYSPSNTISLTFLLSICFGAKFI